MLLKFFIFFFATKGGSDGLKRQQGMRRNTTGGLGVMAVEISGTLLTLGRQQHLQ